MPARPSAAAAPVRLLGTLLALVAVGTGVMSGQELSFKERERLAERFAAVGDYVKAAEQNAEAYALKPRKEEFAFRAAEQFYLVKDYARAAKMYAVVARDFREYPLAGLRYARALKQEGRFREATAAYLDYLSYYKGADRALIERIVEQEVKGTELARQAEREYSLAVVVEPFGPAVNSPGQETAPMPLAPGALYFLADRKGAMRMYRSFEIDGTWMDAEPAGQFPIVSGKHIGPGALSPLGDRYYFSLCDAAEVMTQPTARCALYVILRRDTFWSVPQALPAYINAAGASTSHPYVYREGSLEVMLFASDRLDGYGGMDLYRTERYLNSEATDFSFPENLGPVVNGVGDEVSPFYDATSQTLYFSTNGGINMGGYDVFRTQGGRSGWNAPANAGAPINSPADDYYYRQVPNSPLAVLASNRALRDTKTRTNNEDLYLVRPGTPTLAVRLQVVDSATEINLRDVVLAAYVVEAAEESEGTGDTRAVERRRLLYTDKSDDGYFALALPLGAEVELELQRLDYHPVRETVSVPSRTREGFQLPRLRMARIVLSLADVQAIEDARTGAPVATLPSRPARPRAEGPTARQPEPTPAPVTVEPEPAPVTAADEPAVTTEPASETASPSAAGVDLDTSGVAASPVAVAANEPSHEVPPAAAPAADTPGAGLPEPVATTPPTATTEPTEPTVEPTPTPTPPPAPKPTPTAPPAREYRIQIEARPSYEPEHARYRPLAGIGGLSDDYVDGKGLYRVLVGRYGSYAEAQQALARVRAAGWSDAFVVAFDYGAYKGLVRN